MKSFLSLMALSLLVSTSSLACDCDKAKDTKAASAAPAANSPNPTFESLKKLAGNWEIVMNENGKKEVTKATYEVTSGGNAVLEKINIGTPHEMISVYSNNGKTVAMTHYCMLPNTPRMTLSKTEAGKMFFEMKGKDGIQSKKEHHMHSVELAWNNENELTQTWTSMKDGKLEQPVVFNWKRAAVAKK